MLEFPFVAYIRLLNIIEYNEEDNLALLDLSKKTKMIPYGLQYQQTKVKFLFNRKQNKMHYMISDQE